MRPVTKANLFITATLLILAGCNDTAVPQLPIAGNARSGAGAIVHYRSAIVTGPKANDDLLYVGDSSANLVRIFDYSKEDRPVGQISISPETLCSDASGNVWIDGNYDGSIAMYEFRHDGSGPIATLQESGGENCAVDPKSGDLAVVHWGYPYGAYVDVFRGAMGSAQRITDTSVSDFYFDAYDDHENLVIQGMNYQGQGEVEYAELPAGKNNISNLEVVSVPFPDAGGFAYDGKYFVAAFANRSVIYRYALKKKDLIQVSQTEYNIPNFAFFGITIHKHRMAAYAEELPYYTQREIVKFPYPSGIKAKHPQSTGLAAGIAISVAPADEK